MSWRRRPTRCPASCSAEAQLIHKDSVNTTVYIFLILSVLNRLNNKFCSKLEEAVEVVGGAAAAVAVITSDGTNPSRRVILKNFKARITSDPKRATEAVVARVVAATEMSITEIFLLILFY